MVGKEGKIEEKKTTANHMLVLELAITKRSDTYLYPTANRCSPPKRSGEKSLEIKGGIIFVTDYLFKLFLTYFAVCHLVITYWFYLHKQKQLSRGP